MKWEGREQSTNVEDRRGMRGPAVAAGGGGLVLIVLMIAMKFLGVDANQQQAVINIAKNVQQRAADAAPATAKNGIDDKSREFISVILHDTETIWTKLFKEQVQGASYTPPKVIMFTDSVASGCGNASAAMGPFYCPADEKVYIDLIFYQDLKDRFNSPGDFAQAYVIAHEVGHHVQHLLGITDKVHAARGELSEEEYNKLSVRLELQADFLAGVWAHHANELNDMIEQGDFEEAIDAASAIGDDRLQKRSQGRVTPDSFTHGTSEQRVRWFTKGYKTGDTSQGDTFNTEDL